MRILRMEWIHHILLVIVKLVMWLDFSDVGHGLSCLEYVNVGCSEVSPHLLCRLLQHRPVRSHWSQGVNVSLCNYKSDSYGTGFFIEFWYDSQALDLAHWQCDRFNSGSTFSTEKSSNVLTWGPRQKRPSQGRDEHSSRRMLIRGPPPTLNSMCTSLIIFRHP